MSSLTSACLALQSESEHLQDNIEDSDSDATMLRYWRYCRAWWYAERALVRMGATVEDNGIVERSIRNCSGQIGRLEGKQ